MKDTITEIKTPLERINSRLDDTEEWTDQKAGNQSKGNNPR